MQSTTKAAVIKRHDKNALLHTPAPPLMPTSERDLRVDQPRAGVGEDAILAAVQALRSGQTHYVDVPGIGPLREALAIYLKETFAANYGSSNVLVTAGIQESRFLSLQKIGEQFERILIPAVVHPGVRRALGARPRSFVELAVDENSYLPSLDTISDGLKGGRRLLYLESPSRLTGKVYDAEETSRLVDLLQEYDAGLILDHGLAPWVADDAYRSPAAGSNGLENVVVLGEAWPGMGLDSWFIAYIATPEKWFEAMRSQKQIMAICTSTAAQFAALEAGRSFNVRRASYLEKLAKNRTRAIELVHAAGLTPLPGDAQSVLAIRVDQRKSTIRKLLQEDGYQVADGGDFGAPGVLRLAVALDEASVVASQSLS